MKPTMKQLKAFAEILGASVRKDNAGDIVVRPVKGAEETYFASDTQDALETLRAMLGSHPRISNAENEIL